MHRLIFILILAFCLTQITVFAETADTNTIDIKETNLQKSNMQEEDVVSKIISFDRDIILKGLFMGDRFYFSVDPYWEIEKAAMNLKITHTQLILRGISNYTISLNGYPFYSSYLNEIREGLNNYEIDIPIKYMKEGINEIKIDLYSRINDYNNNICSEDVSDANWAIIHKDSFIKLDFKEKSPSDLISEYPYPFLKTRLSNAAENMILSIPDLPDETELSAALTLASSLGNFKNLQNISLKVKKFSMLTDEDKKNNNIIFVGSMDNIPEDFKKVLKSDIFERQYDEALICRFTSPYNENKKIMLITALSDSNVLKDAANMFFNRDLISQIDSDTCIIEKGANILVKGKDIKSKISLYDLGYTGGIYLDGPFRQKASIGIKLFKNRAVIPGASITLKMRYSENLCFNRSLVTVYVNGIPVGSKKLEKDMANEDLLTLTIPADIKIYSYLDIVVAFDLELPDLVCTPRQKEMPWAYILPESNIYLPMQDEREMIFEYYPWPFVKDGHFNNVIALFSDNVSNTEMDIIFNAFTFMGHEISSNVSLPTVIFDSNFDETKNKGNIIMAGTPDQLNTLKNMNKYMWFKYNDGFEFFESNEKRWMFESFSRTLSAIQLFRLPSCPKCGVLIATSPSASGMLRLKRYLSQSKYVNSMTGNASLIDKEGEVKSHNFIEIKQVANQKRNLLKTKSSKLIIIMFGAVFIFLIISAVLYYKKHKKYK